MERSIFILLTTFIFVTCSWRGFGLQKQIKAETNEFSYSMEKEYSDISELWKFNLKSREILKKENFTNSSANFTFENYQIITFESIRKDRPSQQDKFEMILNDGAKYENLYQANSAHLTYFTVWPSRAYYQTFDGVITNYTVGAKANNAILCPVGFEYKTDFFNDFISLVADLPSD